MVYLWVSEYHLWEWILSIMSILDIEYMSLGVTASAFIG